MLAPMTQSMKTIERWQFPASCSTQIPPFLCEQALHLELQTNNLKASQ